MIEEAMEFFWFPEVLRKMIMKYCNIFQMRLSTGNFTADWHRLKVGIAKGNGEEKSLLKRLDELITWTRKIQGKKKLEPAE